ncbi:MULTISPECIES: ABC transporter substrate-binding protein [unclassified Halorubrum]|uniref:ABC transporter substrate-binding protein n=1 Tax=unclassified Halorubrum TaxID=2642239 RepID=UPI0009AD1862|nr:MULTISPECIES: ABC transporter substrate-binding protein [unclassified Halorubrum]
MAANHEGDPYDQAVSRRKIVSVAGASGLAALAGCSGGGGDGGDTGETSGNTDSGDSIYDATYNDAYNGNPADLHFNTSAVQNYRWPAGRAVFAPFLKYSFNEDEFLLGALENLEIESEEVTLTFREDLSWDNGDDWTTEDLDVQLQLAEKTGSSIWGYLDDYEIVDDNTARLLLSGETNPRIIQFELTNFLVDVKAETHEQFLDQDAQEFLRWAWEDPVASGMWSFVSKDQQAFEFERNPEFYNADNINFRRHLIENTGGADAQYQALIAGDHIDGAMSAFAPPEIVEQFADNVVEVNIPAKWGYGIVFNHDDQHFGKREVRQATAHVINRQSLVENAGPRSKFVAPVPCGIAPEDQEYWLDDWQEDFETYGADASQTEEATQLLEDAGYSKSDGTWQDENGNTISGDYYSPAGWNDWTTMTQTVVSQLNDFGFDFSISTLPTNDWFTQYSDSDFAMSSLYWLPGGSRSAFPYFPLRYQLWEPEIGGGHNYRGPAQSEQTIPGPDGGEMTLTPLDEVDQIAQQPDDESSREYVQRAAWHNHIELPFLGLVSKYEQSWTTDDEWTVASEDSVNRQVKWPQFWWPHEGELQYRG